MKIKLARFAGFCPGVNNAIKTVLELLKKTNKKIYTLGPLIHNKDVIKNLEEKNIYSVESIDEIKDIKNSVLVIRAHGIPPQSERKIIESGIEYIDATCPLVKRVHRIIEKYEKLGYTTIILGDPNHAEVIGLKGYAKDPYIITSEKDALNLPSIEKANLVSQTTQEIDLFERVSEILKTKVKDLIINNTICDPTRQRQKETIEESSKADLVIVIGGKHSANTQRLYQICKNLSKNAILIENENEINEFLFKNIETVFITAGASTPAWLIERVYKKIESLTSKKNILKNIISFMLTTGIFTLLSAISILLYIYISLNTSINKSLFLSLSFAIVAAYIINRKREIKKIEDNIKKEFFIKHQKAISIMMYFFIVISILLALKYNFTTFLFIALFLLSSFLYPKIKEKIKIYGLKDLITAIGWSFVLGFTSLIKIKTYFHLKIITYLIVFLLSLQRNILISIVHNKNDIIETNTFLTDLGKEITFKIFFLSLIIVFFMTILFSLNPFLFLLLILNYFVFEIIRKNNKADLILFESLVDIPYIILGIILVLKIKH